MSERTWPFPHARCGRHTPSGTDPLVPDDPGPNNMRAERAVTPNDAYRLLGLLPILMAAPLRSRVVTAYPYDHGCTRHHDRTHRVSRPAGAGLQAGETTLHVSYSKTPHPNTRDHSEG